MNRRTFLRSIATVCGAAVVCPGELVKSPVQRVYRVSWYGFNPFGSEAERKKYRQNIFVKARQQGMTSSCLRWPNYYAECHKKHMERIAEELEKEFWNTKFKSPLMKVIR